MEQHPETSPIDLITTHVSSHESTVTAIVSAVAEARGTAIDNLDPLNEAVALEALDTLFHHSDDLDEIDLQITFTVTECKVILYGDGRIVVAPRIDDNHDVPRRSDGDEQGAVQ